MKDKFMASMTRFNTIVKEDIKNGLPWAYYNTKRSEPTFDQTRKAGKRYTNCMGGVSFALKDAGIPSSAVQWYGGKGKIVWLNDHAEKDAKKYFKTIDVNNKTVKQAINDGTLQPLDIIIYVAMTHTNVYLGNNKSYDTGHAFCNGSGEGAKYTKWIGSTPYQNYKIAKIIRIKGDTPTYRVRLGIFSNKSNVTKLINKVKAATNLDCFSEQHSDGTHVYCGSYKSKSWANERKKLLNNAGFAAELEKV